MGLESRFKQSTINITAKIKLNSFYNRRLSSLLENISNKDANNRLDYRKQWFHVGEQPADYISDASQHRL